MQRIEDHFIKILLEEVDLAGRSVLEIGCGDGVRSVEVAKHCKRLVGVDPNESSILTARDLKIDNADFVVGNAEDLLLPVTDFYQIALFTLSFHHIHKSLMRQAIDEVLWYVRGGEKVVFFEPGLEGSLFDAEIRFDAWDGDEREAKKAAQVAMNSHPRLLKLGERRDRSVFSFNSVEDFMTSMKPKKNQEGVQEFLEQYHYVLDASRIISIFSFY